MKVFSSILLATLAGCATVHPTGSTVNYAETSVKITNAAESSGGTGVILNSSSDGSDILTNRHVCGLVNSTAKVITQEGGRFLIESFKPSKVHDLCLIHIKADLGVSTKVASSAPDLYSKAYISGHPHLYPHVLTKGDFTGMMQVQIATGTRPCTEADMKGRSAILCLFLGGIPVVETYQAQLVSATIMPGSSGSAVFNSQGEIAGLAFAGDNRQLSYAIIVPQEFVYNFVNSEVSVLKPEFPVSATAGDPEHRRLIMGHVSFMPETSNVVTVEDLNKLEIILETLEPRFDKYLDEKINTRINQCTTKDLFQPLSFPVYGPQR